MMAAAVTGVLAIGVVPAVSQGGKGDKGKGGGKGGPGGGIQKPGRGGTSMRRISKRSKAMKVN